MKYNMKICKCGRIHMIDDSKIEKALENEKDFLLVCGSCGMATVIGADKEPDFYDPNKTCHIMYSYDLDSDKSITPDAFTTAKDHKGIEEIFYSNGLKVPIMTGMYATDYIAGNFSDGWCPDLYKIKRDDITKEEVFRFIDEYNHDRITVDMGRFIRETPDDMLEEISHYYIKGFNWKGTKYERILNS